MQLQVSVRRLLWLRWSHATIKLRTKTSRCRRLEFKSHPEPNYRNTRQREAIKDFFFFLTKKKKKEEKLTNQTADHEGERLEQKQDNPPYHQLFGAHVFNNGPRHGEGKVGSGGEEENVTPSEEQSGPRRRNVASAADGNASWTPPSLLCSCLLTSKEEGGKAGIT